LQMAQTYISALCDLLERGKRWRRGVTWEVSVWGVHVISQGACRTNRNS
jgi:hypothetical protein